jgi:hypothetical protein
MVPSLYPGFSFGTERHIRFALWHSRHYWHSWHFDSVPIALLGERVAQIRITLWQHDGSCVWVLQRSRIQHWENRINVMVNNHAASLGIATYLESG